MALKHWGHSQSPPLRLHTACIKVGSIKTHYILNPVKSYFRNQKHICPLKNACWRVLGAPHELASAFSAWPHRKTTRLFYESQPITAPSLAPKHLNRLQNWLSKVWASIPRHLCGSLRVSPQSVSCSQDYYHTANRLPLNTSAVYSSVVVGCHNGEQLPRSRLLSIANLLWAFPAQTATPLRSDTLQASRVWTPAKY